MTNTIQFPLEEALKRYEYLYGKSKHAVLFDTTGQGHYTFHVYNTETKEELVLRPIRKIDATTWRTVHAANFPGWEKGDSFDLWRFIADNTPQEDANPDSPEVRGLIEACRAVQNGMASLIEYLELDGAFITLPDGWDKESEDE